MSIAVFGGFCLNILWESYPSTGKDIYFFSYLGSYAVIFKVSKRV